MNRRDLVAMIIPGVLGISMFKNNIVPESIRIVADNEFDEASEDDPNVFWSNLVVSRDDQNGPMMTFGPGNRIRINMTGYAIIPIETYLEDHPEAIRKAAS